MIKTFEQFVNENYRDDVNGAMPVDLSNYEGRFLLKSIYDSKRGEKFYNVYYSPTKFSNDSNIKMVGEYTPTVSIEDDHKKYNFEHFQMWLSQNFSNRIEKMYEVRCPDVELLTEDDVKRIISEFARNGFDVCEPAIMHNFDAWQSGAESGFLDHNNGYHLYTPSNNSPLSFRATTLHPECEEWQKTYAR